MYVLTKKEYGYGREPDEVYIYGYTDDPHVADAWAAVGHRYKAEFVQKVVRENGLFKLESVV